MSIKQQKISIASKKIFAQRIKINIDLKNKKIKDKKKKIKIDKTQIQIAISGLLEEIKKSLLNGENIRFPGYFSMHTVMSKPREAMNLQTGKKMKVPAKLTPKVKFSLDLKKEIAAGKGKKKK